MIELVLMITLLGVMAGSYLAVVDFSANALDRAARRVESDLRYAQQLATTEEVNHGFITVGNWNYTVYRQTQATPVTDPHTRTPMNINIATSFNNASFGGPYQIEFNALGRPVIGGGTQIVINHGNQTRTVTVTATTGYIQVQ